MSHTMDGKGDDRGFDEENSRAANEVPEDIGETVSNSNGDAAAGKPAPPPNGSKKSSPSSMISSNRPRGGSPPPVGFGSKNGDEENDPRPIRTDRRRNRRHRRHDRDEEDRHQRHGLHLQDDAAEDMYYNSRHSQLPLKFLIVVGILVILLLIGLIIAVAVTLSGTRSGDDTIPVPPVRPPSQDSGVSPSPTGVPIAGPDVAPPLASSSPTLNAVLKRGYVACGIPEQPGFATWNLSENRYDGLDADLCRAIAAAVFGQSQNVDSYVKFTVLYSFDRFIELHAGNVDLLARTTTHTMERQVKERTTGAGFDFSIPYLYSGLQLAGAPDFVKCADEGSLEGPCNATKVCVLDGTTHVAVVQGLFKNQDAPIVASVASRILYQNYNDGFCNVIAGEQHDVVESVARANGVAIEYEVSSKTHSKEPLCLVSRNDDAVWSDLLNWVLQGLLATEERHITQQRANIVSPLAEVFGVRHSLLVRHAVQAVGNFGEIYQRNLHSILPRPTADRINIGATGLLYSFPFGALTVEGNPRAVGTLEDVRRRGFLRCGISKRAIFAIQNETTGDWAGFDVDFCKSLSAAIFNGVTDSVVYFDLSASERFQALQNKTVDVLSRITTHTLSRDVYEPSTSTGFSFSQPTFYDGLSLGGIPPFVDCADNLDVSSNNCRSLKICVNEGTTFEVRLKTLFPDRFVNVRPSGKESIQSLVDQTCNVFAGGAADVSVTAVRETGYDGPYRSGSNRYSKDPLAMVTRQDDPLWSSLVFWIVSGTFYAEEMGIRPGDFASMPQVGLFGPDMMDMFRHMIRTVGSYRDIYERNAEKELPRAGLNKVNFLLEGPQHYPLPGILK